MNKLKIGIIGCGKQGEKHLSSLLRLKLKGRNIEPLLTDTDVLKAKRLSEQFNITYVKDQQKLFTDPTISAVIIATPLSSHNDLIIRSLKASKDVFCEKPLCSDLNEASAIKKAEEESTNFVMVGYIYRFTPIFEKLNKFIKNNKNKNKDTILGKIHYALLRLGGRGSHEIWKHQKKSKGGVINEMLVHMLDLANWIFGPLTDIQIISYNLFAPKRVIRNKIINVDAADFILLKCKGFTGMEVFCQADLITPSFCQYIDVQGSNGSFFGSIQNDMPSYIFLKEDSNGYPGNEKIDLSVENINIIDVQMEAFVDAVMSRRFPDRNRTDDSISLLHIVNQIKKKVEHE